MIQTNKLKDSSSGVEIVLKQIIKIGENYRNINDDKDVAAHDFVKADTSGGAIKLTLPSSPDDNDMLWVWDITGSFDKNNCTLDGNGTKIMGDDTFVLDVKNKEYHVIYDDNSSEWRVS